MKYFCTPEMDGVWSHQNYEDGAHVDKNAEVGSIELMKTFYPVYAPETGVITYKVELGTMVAAHQTIAEIES